MNNIIGKVLTLVRLEGCWVTFLEKLDLLMAEKGITRGGLAKGSGVPYTTIIGLYEKGYENVKLSTIRKIAGFLNVSIEYLCDEGEQDRVRDDESGASVERLYRRITEMTPKQRELLWRLTDTVLEFVDENEK